MNMDKIKEVFSDEEFVKALFDLESPEEVEAALAEKEIEMTTEEICQVRDLLIRYQDGELTEEEQKTMELAEKFNDGELSDEELENVSGGGLFAGIAIGAFVIIIVGLHIADAIQRRW